MGFFLPQYLEFVLRFIFTCPFYSESKLHTSGPGTRKKVFNIVKNKDNFPYPIIILQLLLDRNVCLSAKGCGISRKMYKIYIAFSTGSYKMEPVKENGRRKDPRLLGRKRSLPEDVGLLEIRLSEMSCPSLPRKTLLGICVHAK